MSKSKFHKADVNERVTIFEFILYPDGLYQTPDVHGHGTFELSTCTDLLNYLRYLYRFEKYAYCLHDKDDVKPHIHFVVNFKDAHTQTGIASKLEPLNISPNDIYAYGGMGALENRVQYLVHFNDLSKYQYSVHDCHSRGIDVSSYLVERNSESNDIALIFKQIYEHRLVNIGEVLQFGLDHDCWSTVRRNYSIIKDYLAICSGKYKD